VPDEPPKGQRDRRTEEEEAWRQGKPPRTVILCPGCERKVRLPAARLVELHTVRCPSCHQLLG
jgi:uncharacterized paraquat-inducible protein A